MFVGWLLGCKFSGLSVSLIQGKDQTRPGMTQNATVGESVSAIRESERVSCGDSFLC